MAGILDKKTRIFDYILTKEGRSQLKDDGDLRFVYATVSDRGIEYSSKQTVKELTYAQADEAFTQSPLKISDSERLYLGFEATSTFVDTLNPEYNLIDGVSYPKFTEEVVDLFGLNQFNVTDNFSKIAAEMTGSFVSKINALKIIDTENQLEKDEIILDNSFKLEEISYNFNGRNIEDYPTIFSSTLNIDKLKTIKEDLRFSHKNNFKKLNPVNTDGSSIVSEPEQAFSGLNPYNFVFKKYEKKINLSAAETREISIAKIITELEKDKRLYKTTFNVTNPTENDTWIIQLYETNTEGKKFDKLAAIDLGEFYFSDEGLNKRVFLFGKIFKNKKIYKEDLKSDDLHASVYKKEIVLSEQYSFINIFTLVAE